jgi:putative salt-induced outer membrane protein
MKRILNRIIMAVGILLAFACAASAQTNASVYTTTNVVTVLVTNVVTITNVVAPVPPPPAPVVAAPEPKYPWNSSVSAGLTLTRGNSHSMVFTADISTQKKTPENEYSLGASLSYGNQAVQTALGMVSKDNVNNYKAYGQWNHLFTDRFFSYVRVDALRDIIADVDYRVNVGPGAGYYLLKEDATTLAVEAGASQEFQRLGSNDEAFLTVRFAERFEHKFKDWARVWQSVEFLPQVEQFDNYVVNFQVGAEASLTKSLSLKTTLDDTYQSIPAAGRLKNDVKIISGVSYKF